jgi:hypothetical protein
MDQRSSDKSPVEHPCFTRSCLPSKTVQKLYEKTPRGKISMCSFFTLTRSHVRVARKLTEKLRAAYAPLAEDCCKAILTIISSNIAELKSGTGTFFRLSSPLLLERNLSMTQMLMFARSHF